MIVKKAKIFLFVSLIKYPTVNINIIHNLKFLHFELEYFGEIFKFPELISVSLVKRGMFQRIVKLTLQEPKIVPRNILLREFNRNKRSRTQYTMYK